MRFFYRSSEAEKKVKTKFPAERILSVEPSKVIVIKSCKDKILDLNWLFSKRLNVVLTNDSVHIGNASLDRSLIKEPHIFHLSTFFGAIKYQVVRFNIEDEFYYLGMDHSKQWNKISDSVKIENYNNKSSINWVFFLLAILLFLISKLT